jgi:eukaryotic translation initiation factor 2C
MSIASLVGSYDKECTKYFPSLRVQAKNKQEIISDIRLMVKEQLKNFQNENKNALPEHVLFYRDGVSEGQFDHVIEYEVKEIKEAFKEVNPKSCPKLTLIIVQKRHHTRFRPVNPADGVGGPKNIPPGTVVDTKVVHPTDFDFFLCSHTGIQGTSRPAHYYVILDENNFGANELQRLSFYLCHIYSKCPRSISLPAPVMYADLAAYRARQHLIAENGSEAGSVVNQGEEELSRSQIDKLNGQIRVSFNSETKNYNYYL